jgi:hypothetical protein
VRKSVDTPFPLSLVRHKHPIVASGAQIHTFQVFPFASCIKRLGSVLRYAADVFAKPDPISTIGRKHVMLNLHFVPLTRVEPTLFLEARDGLRDRPRHLQFFVLVCCVSHELSVFNNCCYISTEP